MAMLAPLSQMGAAGPAAIFRRDFCGDVKFFVGAGVGGTLYVGSGEWRVTSGEMDRAKFENGNAKIRGRGAYTPMCDGKCAQLHEGIGVAGVPVCRVRARCGKKRK